MSANIENSSSGSAQATPAEASADTTASGAVADPQDGACAPGTLHDFVSSLINDEAAKAAYLADPLGALGAAGLSGLSPADVQDALPLVADSLPTDLAGLPGLGDLPLDLPTGLPTGLPALGDLPGLGDLPVSLPTDGLAGVTDALPMDGLTGALPVDGLTGALPVDGLTDALPTGGLPSLDGLTGALDAGGLSAVTGLAGALPTDGLTGALPVDGLTGALPVDGLSGLTGLAGALPTDGLTDALPTDGLPAVGDLPVVGDLPISLPTGVPSLGDLPVAGDLPVDVPALGDLGGLTSALPTDGLPGLGDLPIGDLPQLPTLETPLGDVTAVVDGATGLAGVAADTDLVDSSTAGLLSNVDADGAATLASHSESVLGSLAGEANLGSSEFGGAIAGAAPLVSVGGDMQGSTDGDLHLWGGSNTPFGHTAVHVDAGTDGLAVAAVSPLGDLGANSDGDFAIQPADTSDLLDVDHLGTTGDAVVGTVAHVVTTGSNALADGVDNGTDTLGGYLTGTPLAPVGGTVDMTTSTVTDAVHDGGGMVADHLPNSESLPLDQLPQLPQLPDLPDVNSADLPTADDVTGHLPVSLPQVQLPDTSAVTDLVSHNPVTDAVHQSPVGGLVDGVTGHLPQVGDHLPVVGDLDLGL